VKEEKSPSGNENPSSRLRQRKLTVLQEKLGLGGAKDGGAVPGSV